MSTAQHAAVLIWQTWHSTTYLQELQIAGRRLCRRRHSDLFSMPTTLWRTARRATSHSCATCRISERVHRQPRSSNAQCVLRSRCARCLCAARGPTIARRRRAAPTRRGHTTPAAFVTLRTMTASWPTNCLRSTQPAASATLMMTRRPLRRLSRADDELIAAWCSQRTRYARCGSLSADSAVPSGGEVGQGTRERRALREA